MATITAHGGIGTAEQVDAERQAATEEGRSISDWAARTIASWWHSPGAGSENITRLSHGLPADPEQLREEVNREIADDHDRADLLAWISAPH